jgi:hypothetical protein
MFLNERIDNVPAGHTSPPFHPHWNTALPNVDQIICHHEPVTSYAMHGALLSLTLAPEPRHHTQSLSKPSRPAANRLPIYESNRDATDVVATACVFSQ